MQHPNSRPSDTFGTSQFRRQLDQFASTYVQLDERTEADLMRLGAQFAELVNFFDENNELDGTFDGFFKADISIILASISSTQLQPDIDTWKTAFHYLSLQPAETTGKLLNQVKEDETALILSNVLELLYRQVHRCNEWLTYLHRADEGLALTSLIRKLLLAKLGEWLAFFSAQFKTEIQLHNRILTAEEQATHWSVLEKVLNQLDLWPDLDSLSDLVRKHNYAGQPLPPQPPSSGLITLAPPPDFSGQVAYLLPLLEYFIEGFFQAQQQILDKVPEYLAQSLSSEQDHRPQTALFLAFIRLFGSAQSDLNLLSARHLAFYFREVLLQQERPRIPQKAILTTKLAKQVLFHPVPKGTQFLAGKSSDGAPIFFQSTQDTLLNQVQLSALSTLFVSRDDQTPPNVRQFYLAPKADSADGHGAKFPADSDQSWPGFGAIPAEESSKDLVEMGLAISSPMLLLAEGSRTISMVCQLESLPDSFNSLSKACFLPELSGKKQWISPTDFELDLQVNPSGEGSLTFTFTLAAKTPAVVPYQAKALKDPQPYFSEQWPVLRIRLAETNGVHPYTYLAGAKLTNIDLSTSVQGVKSLALYTDTGKATAQHPFAPLTGLPKLGGEFLIGYAEAFQKQLSTLTTHIRWKDLPKDGFPAYYKVYNDDASQSGEPELPFPNNEVFTATASVLGQGSWHAVPVNSSSSKEVNLSAFPLFTDQDGPVMVAGQYPREIFPLWLHQQVPGPNQVFTPTEIHAIQSLGNRYYLTSGDSGLKADLEAAMGGTAMTPEKYQLLASLLVEVNSPTAQATALNHSFVYSINEALRLGDILDQLGGSPSLGAASGATFLSRTAVLDAIYSSSTHPEPAASILQSWMPELAPSPSLSRSLLAFLVPPYENKLDEFIDSILHFFHIKPDHEKLADLNGQLFVNIEECKQAMANALGEDLSKISDEMALAYLSQVSLDYQYSLTLFSRETELLYCFHYSDPLGKVLEDKGVPQAVIAEIASLSQQLYETAASFEQQLKTKAAGINDEAKAEIMKSFGKVQMHDGTHFPSIYLWNPARFLDPQFAELIGTSPDDLLSGQVFSDESAYQSALEATSIGQSLSTAQKDLLATCLTFTRLPQGSGNLGIFTYSETLRTALPYAGETPGLKADNFLQTLSNGVYVDTDFRAMLTNPQVDGVSFSAAAISLIEGFFTPVTLAPDTPSASSSAPLLDTLDFSITDFSSILPAPALSSPLSLTPNQTAGFFKLKLHAPKAGFGIDLYEPLLIKQLLSSANTIGQSPPVYDPTQFPPPNKPYIPQIQSISLDYQAEESISLGTDSSTRFYHISPFSTYEVQGASPFLLEQYEEEGYLHIGLEGVIPPLELSLLVQVASKVSESTIHPMPAISWEYLSGNTWTLLDSTAVQDGTLGFLTSGIIRIQLPADLSIQEGKTIPPAFTRMPSETKTSLAWLRAKVARDAAWLEPVISIEPQAIEVEWSSNSAPPQRPLPALSITKLAQTDQAIQKISQPYPGFGGRLAEDQVSMYTRLSERLRHKQRGMMAWDYERLVLQAFPNLYNVACLPFMTSDRGETPGAIMIVVLPEVNPSQLPALPAKADRATLEEVKEFVQQHTSPFVEVEVRNPAYLPLQIVAEVDYLSTAGRAYYDQLLQQALEKFLAPYFYQQNQLKRVKRRLLRTDIWQFIRDLPFVAKVNLTEVKFADQPLPPDEINVLAPPLPWGLFISSQDHVITPFPPAATVSP